MENQNQRDRRCRKCGKVKPLDAFAHYRGRSLDRDTVCRECVRNRIRGWRAQQRAGRLAAGGAA